MSASMAGGPVSLERELHDLCQPLTTLQCRLELGQMMNDELSLREAVAGALEECRRMFDAVAAMRDRMRERATDGKAEL